MTITTQLWILSKCLSKLMLYIYSVMYTYTKRINRKMYTGTPTYIAHTVHSLYIHHTCKLTRAII